MVVSEMLAFCLLIDEIFVDFELVLGFAIDTTISTDQSI